MKALLWDDYMIPADEVGSAVECGENFCIIEGVSSDAEIRIMKKFEEKDIDLSDVEDVENFLSGLGIEGADIYYSKHYEEVRNCLAFDFLSQTVSSLSDMETVAVYEYWDGSNTQTLPRTELTTETVLEVSHSSVDLDEWDGRNHTTGGMWNHQRVYRVLYIDGEIPDEETFLLEMSTQFDEDITEGQLFNKEELRDHLKSLGRDVEKYMTDIQSL